MANEPAKRRSLDDAKVLLRPANLLKTVASFVPGAAAFGEALGQLESEHVERRIGDLEAWRELRELEKKNPSPNQSPADWSHAVAEFHPRTIDLCVFYDGGFEHPSRQGRELFLHIAHGSLIDQTRFLTTNAALDTAREVAVQRGGRIVLIAGTRHFLVNPANAESRVGLSVCGIGAADTARDEKLNRIWSKQGLEPPVFVFPTKPAAHTVTPWLGNEVGFLHSGEATDAMRPDRMSRLQFDCSAISHFRGPSRNGLKVGVTGVLGGRFTFSGSPVFTRSGVLVGCIGESVSYDSDAGRRAVIYGLLGHPVFTPSMRRG